MKRVVIVSSDFNQTGGMDRANYALASYLARQGREVHLVAHSVDAGLLALPGVHFHRVARPLRSNLIGEKLIDRAGRYWAARLTDDDTRVVVNGGNCVWPGANWVHYVHAAYEPTTCGHWSRRAKANLSRRMFLANERAAVPQSQLIFANSERTRHDLMTHLRLPGEKIRTIYLGVDPRQFHPATSAERSALRQKWGWGEQELVMMFIGALGDRRKGFDLVMEAWQKLCKMDWNVRLVVVGIGAEIPRWKREVEAQSWKSPVEFLGFRRDVPDLLRACDGLLSPTRYESYGLGVHEAIACGVPALVSASAGVAERYKGSGLDDLLLPDPEDTDDLASRLAAWRSRASAYRLAIEPLSQKLRSYTWDDMAAAMTHALEEH